MKYEEVLLTAEYVRFFCSDPPNYTHNHFDISVPSDPFSTRVSSEQRELYHTCLQTSLGEGGDSRGRKFLKNTVLETLVWPCAEGLDCSADWLRAHHSLYITHPACRQRKNRGPGYVLGRSTGMVIFHEESEYLQVLLVPLHVQNEMSRVWRQWCQQTLL